MTKLSANMMTNQHSIIIYKKLKKKIDKLCKIIIKWQMEKM